MVVGPGAKVFEQFFCELFLEPGDAVLVFSARSSRPTSRTSAAAAATRCSVPLRQENAFRPDLDDVEQFLKTMPRARRRSSSTRRTTRPAAWPRRTTWRRSPTWSAGTDVAVFSDEPYCHMVWEGRHRSILAEPGMIDQCVAAYTFSKSYSMSGWRFGLRGRRSPRHVEVIGKMINTSLSCVPPIVQLAGKAALEHDAAERDEVMAKFRKKVELLVERAAEGRRA